MTDNGLKYAATNHYFLYAGASNEASIVKKTSCVKPQIVLQPDDSGAISFYNCSKLALDNLCHWITKAKFSKDVPTEDLVILYGVARVKKFHASTAKIVAYFKDRRDMHNNLITHKGIQNVYANTKAGLGLRAYVVDLFLYVTRYQDSKTVYDTLMQHMMAGNYDFQAECHQKLRNLMKCRHKAINPNSFYRNKRCQYHEHPADFECEFK